MPEQTAEELLAENARLRQELQHHNDERTAYQQRYTGSAVMCTATASFFGQLRGPDGVNLGPGRRFLVESEIIKEERRAAQVRAIGLLETKIGKSAMAKIGNGGAYPIRSKHWDDVIYYVPRDPHEKVRVMQRGSVIMESCLVTTDHNLPWADVMLQRILALEIDESVVVATGVVHNRRSEDVLKRMRNAITRGLNRLGKR